MAQVPSITVLDSDEVEREVATLTAIAAILGEVQASPTGNTLLDRVKTLASILGEVQANPTANTLQDRVKTLAALVGEVQANPTANTLLDRLKTIGTALVTGPVPVEQKTTAHDIALPITRPPNVTAYSANDVVGQTATAILTFSGIGKSGGSILITRAELELDISVLPAGMASFRLYLYSSAPPSNFADNAAFTFAGADRAPFLGYIDLGAPVLLGGGTLYCKVSGINEQMKLAAASSDIFAYLVTAGGYTPAANSEGYKVTLHSVDM
ncbi:hypothetical protein [Rhizobium leguminosarum]|uniref:hypothetical protein n=1 Tax=Rhizobium leguminosarum TaxID=384 RepID=UPI00140F9826|nr:hypothetical protein [Rhizobium leguminosarum]QIO64766.1 hypothetical protein HA462_06785 [Rhizobium leguminosarum bv. trifolii]